MNFNPADLIFSNPVPILCEIIKAHQKMDYSHVALATGIEDEVIGAEAEGITKRKLHVNEKKDFVILRYTKEFNIFQDDKIIEWVESKVGLPIYDYGQLFLGLPLGIDLHTPNSWVCSSFVAEAFRQAGITLVERRKPWKVELIHVWICPLLEIINGTY